MLKCSKRGWGEEFDLRVIGDMAEGATDQGSIGTDATLRERVMIDKGQGATDQGRIGSDTRSGEMQARKRLQGQSWLMRSFKGREVKGLMWLSWRQVSKSS
jgi:hypothetical protein